MIEWPHKSAASASWAEAVVGPVALSTRARAEHAWCPETAHPRFRDPGPGTPPSFGQCGVSSLLLLCELAGQGIDADFVRGSLTFRGDVADIEDHCWLQWSDTDGFTWVVDITADQSGYGLRVVHLPIAVARKDGMTYRGQQRLTRADLLGSALAARLAVLRSRLPRPAQTR